MPADSAADGRCPVEALGYPGTAFSVVGPALLTWRVCGECPRTIGAQDEIWNPSRHHPKGKRSIQAMRQPSSSASLERWEQAGESLPRGSADAPSYLTLLTRQRLLTSEEEIELSTRARKGDIRAKDRLVEANMRLVINIAKAYRSTRVPFEDLIQEGTIGLVMAA